MAPTLVFSTPYIVILEKNTELSFLKHLWWICFLWEIWCLYKLNGKTER